MDNDEQEEHNLQKQRDEIDRQLRMRQRANAKARKQEEERQLIAAGEGPRKAKVQALKDASWYAAQGKKRPHSPENDPSLSRARDPNAMTVDQPLLGNNKAKRAKGPAREELEESEGGGERKKSTVKQRSNSSRQHDARPGSTVTEKKKSSKAGKSQATSTIANADDDSESTSPSSPESDNNGLSKDDQSGASDKESDGGDEDDLDISGLTDKDLRKVLDNEVPRDASNLFDDNVEVETASIRSHRSYKSASSVSRPPTSGSDDAFGDGGSDTSGESEHGDDEELDGCSLPKLAKGKAAKQPSKRDMALKAERPTTLPVRRSSSKRNTSSVQIESDVEDTSRTTKTGEKAWSRVARLNHGALRQQNDYIRATCRDAIKIVEKTLVAEHAWPELHKAATYKREVLLDAVTGLVDNDNQYRGLRERIKKDDKFVQEIGRWVIDRLSHHRGTIRGVASEHIALFQLGVGEGCAQRVQALIDNDVYVYPGEWGTDNKGNPVWVTKGSNTLAVQPYLNPGLVEIIRTAFFAHTTAFGSKFTDLYVSSHPSDPKPELTIPLIALGATALYAALWEWRSGKKAKSENKKIKTERFEGDMFKSVFERHVEALKAFKTKVNTYHRVMSTLYEKVTEENNAVGAGNAMKGNALAVLDLDGLD